MLRRLLLLLLAAMGSFALVEVGYRIFGGQSEVVAGRVAGLRSHLEGRGGQSFAPHPYMGFVLADAVPAPLPLGWKFPREKTEGVPRIACLGASTTQEGYPRELQQMLFEDARLAECMNWGVAGWTSMETMINWFVNVQDYDPDVVIVHLGANDVAPRRIAGFRPDYGHYRRPWKEPELSVLTRLLCRVSDLYAEWVVEREGFDIVRFVNRDDVPLEDRRSDRGGDLTADTAGPFRRNVGTICEHARATGKVAVLMTMPWQPAPNHAHHERAHPLLVEGMLEHNAILRELAVEHGALLVDAAAACEAAPEQWSPTFTDIVHQNKEGRRLKARLVADALRSIELPAVPAAVLRAAKAPAAPAR